MTSPPSPPSNGIHRISTRRLEANVLGILVMSFTWMFMPIMPVIVPFFGRGFTQVVLKDELNSRVRPELRATANSVSSLGVRLDFAALGPLLGKPIDGPGYPAALTAAAGLHAVIGLAIAVPLGAQLACDASTRRDTE